MRRPRWPEALLAAALLALAFAVLHHDAVRVGWSFDDPAHLHFAATHTPWQYFTQRAVMLQQSYAHVTPWNILFYDIGLPWAGLDARLHHLHLLGVLWAAAFASWALFRRWLSPAPALVGALFFVAMPATASVGRMLMTGHYAYGLLFSVLALHAWAVALQAWDSDRCRAVAYAGLTALLYALASLCKELYVPLPAVLLCMPVAGLGRPRRWRERLLLLLPVAAVAMSYVALRLWLFGGLGVGGHAALMNLRPSSENLVALLANLRGLLWGQEWQGWAALAVTASLLFLAWRAPRHANAWPMPTLLFVGACAIALLLPIVPLALAGEMGPGHHRLIFALAWALSAVIAWQLQGAGWLRWALAAALGALLITGQREAAAFIDGVSRPLARHYEFVLQGTSDDHLVPRHFDRIGYLRAMADVVRLRTGREAPAVVADEEQFAALGPAVGPRAHAWAEECACLRPLGEAYETRVQASRDQLLRGSQHPLRVELALFGEGPRKVLQWQLTWAAEGQQSPATSIWFDVPGIGRLDTGAQGRFAFGVDNTLPMPDPLALRFNVQLADGAWLQSPRLHIPLSGTHALRWQAGQGLPVIQPLGAAADR